MQNNLYNNMSLDSRLCSSSKLDRTINDFKDLLCNSSQISSELAVLTIITNLQDGALRVTKLLQDREVEYSTNSNASGDNQLKVDVVADNIFGEILSNLSIKGFASEERDGIMLCSENKKCLDSALLKLGDSNSINLAIKDVIESRVMDCSMQELLVAFDPLDGSSLMDSNLSIGSIFGIYADTFTPQNLIASLYFLYGPRLEMVVAADFKSSHYMYDFNHCRWRFIQDFNLKQRGKINASGGTQKYWYSNHKKLIENFFNDGYRLRYSGGMVPDLHQILCKGGGIFSYPATSDSPNGKLRKLFEVYPFALIFEYAGGGAIDGRSRLLDGELHSVHESSPCFFGSNDEIERVRESYSNMAID